jgi:hypothetical protein
MSEKRNVGNKEVEVIPAHSIREEKEYIKTLKCPQCGGEFGLLQQAVFPEQKLDLLLIQCRHCQTKKELYFDISSFFGVPQQ